MKKYLIIALLGLLFASCDVALETVPNDYPPVTTYYVGTPYYSTVPPYTRYHNHYYYYNVTPKPPKPKPKPNYTPPRPPQNRPTTPPPPPQSNGRKPNGRR